MEEFHETYIDCNYCRARRRNRRLRTRPGTPANPAEQPPTNRMDQVTTTTRLPTASSDCAKNWPYSAKRSAPMKSTDPQSVDTGAKPATIVADEQWVGRYVYSSDGKDLGKIASVKKTGTSSDIFFDTGGFLGLGATRSTVTSDQVPDILSDRIVLRLSEADAKSLPADDNNSSQK